MSQRSNFILVWNLKHSPYKAFNIRNSETTSCWNHNVLKVRNLVCLVQRGSFGLHTVCKFPKEFGSIALRLDSKLQCLSTNLGAITEKPPKVGRVATILQWTGRPTDGQDLISGAKTNCSIFGRAPVIRLCPLSLIEAWPSRTDQKQNSSNVDPRVSFGIEHPNEVDLFWTDARRRRRRGIIFVSDREIRLEIWHLVQWGFRGYCRWGEINDS